MPEWGLSLQKPSTLWPPPSEEMATKVQTSLRSRIRETLGVANHQEKKKPNVLTHHESAAHQNRRAHASPEEMDLDVGPTTPLPNVESLETQTLSVTTESGETVEVQQQVHMYAQNSLLVHPLVSPCLSYLGGLPPLLVIASDKEVLRDEIIYT